MLLVYVLILVHDDVIGCDVHANLEIVELVEILDAKLEVVHILAIHILK
jgi:hypothetical protein